jgi:hypothetical protein
MTKEEKKRLTALVRATESLFLENISLKLVLEYHKVPHWQKLLDKLISDKEMLAGVRLRFQPFYEEVSEFEDSTTALDRLLQDLPLPKKAN